MFEIFMNCFLSFLVLYIGNLYGDYRYLKGRIDLLEEMTKDEKAREKLK